MKRLILPLLLLLAIGMLVAAESPASDVVGYFKVALGEGTYNGVTLPFEYTDLTVQNVLGSQFIEGDELILIDPTTAPSTVYYADFGWFGEIENFVYGDAYNLLRPTGNASGDFFLMGKVNPQEFTKSIFGEGAYTAFGLNEASPIFIDNEVLGFTATEGDEIILIDNEIATSTVFYSDFGWFGELEYLSPTRAYYYKSADTAVTFDWTYTPASDEPGRALMPINRKVKK